jgi:hypothetical protein
MGVILFFAVVFLIIIGGLYLLQFYMELNGDKNMIIKDGLVGEFLTKMADERVPFKVGYEHVKVGRFEIRKSDVGLWFPYYIYRNALPYDERTHDDDKWDKNIGYVKWLSKDWKLINELLKAKKTSYVEEQRKKLLLDK